MSSHSMDSSMMDDSTNVQQQPAIAASSFPHTSSSTSSSSSSSIPRSTIQMDGRDEIGDFIGAGEAAQVIDVDGNESKVEEEDETMMEDETMGETQIEQEDDIPLTEEEKKKRDSDHAKTTALATEIRDMLDADDSVQGFFASSESVFCVAFSKHQPNLAFSGDGNDQAYIWDISNGNQKLHLTGHTDSVIDGGFSSDGRYVATASMDATVRVYNADGSLKIKLEGPSSELEWMKWHPAGPVIAAGSTDSNVWVWNAETGECIVFAGHSGGVTCGDWTPDGKQLITCDEKGDVIVWNPKAAKNGAQDVKVFHMKVHDGAITSFHIHPESNLKHCITGGHDGEVHILNYETGKQLSHYKSLHKDSVEGVQFSSSKWKLAASCSVDGEIKILSLSDGQVRLTCKHQDAVTHIEWSPSGEPILFSSSVDKTVRLWDARSGQCLQEWKGHSDAVLTFAVNSLDGGTIITGSDDHTSLVFKRKMQ